jgi:ectoine hydroxylase-related dioxygenase (phytanoyl-CoA dioxygenase family)
MAALMAAQARLSNDVHSAKEDLDTHGYCLLRDALTKEEVAIASRRLQEQAKAEQQLGVSFHDSGPSHDVLDPKGYFRHKAFSSEHGGVNQRVFMLINKGACFRDLVIHARIDKLVGHVLGKDFILSTLTANIARIGGVRMGLHTDQWWMPQPVRPGSDYIRPSMITRHPAASFVSPDTSLGIAPPVVVTALWMLSDFTSGNGATEVVPGSHLSGAYARPADQERYNIVQPEAPAGTLLVFDGRLWHGTGANTEGPDRLAVLATYCAPQFRQQENQTLGLDPALWDSLPEEMKARLGFKVWNGYGRIEQEFGGYVSPDQKCLGELSPKS